MAIEPMSAADLTAALEALPGWSHEGDKLHRELVFRDFRAAFGFMASVAVAAEAADHHPEWFNVYRTVRIWLTTHEAGNKVTTRDVALAREIDARAAPFT